MSLRHAIRLSRHTLPAFVAEGVFWGAFAAFVPELKASIGASDGVFGSVLLSAAIGAVFAMWLAPIFARRIGGRAMAAAAVLLALSFQAPMWVSSVWFFAVLFVLAGAGSGLLDVVMNARLSMIESRHKVSLMNLNHSAFSFAYATSAMAAGLAREVGVSPKLVFFALLLGVVALSFRMIQTDIEQFDHTSDAKPLRLPAAVFWGGAVILVAFLCEQAVEGWSALHIERTLNGGAAQGAIGPAILGLTMGIGRFAGQVVTAWISAVKVLILGAVLSAIGAAVAAVAQTPMMAYFGFSVLGLGVSVMAPMAFALIGEQVSDGQRPQAISRAALVGYVGFFIGPPMIGFVAEATSLRMSFALIAFLMLLAPLLTLRMRGAGGR